jgi:thiamine biosynthesis protein ThiS
MGSGVLVRLWINGKACETPVLASVADLARWLNLPTFGSAVELNGRVIRRTEHSGTMLQEDDRLEVVRLVGGG